MDTQRKRLLSVLYRLKRTKRREPKKRRWSGLKVPRRHRPRHVREPCHIKSGILHILHRDGATPLQLSSSVRSARDVGGLAGEMSAGVRSWRASHYCVGGALSGAWMRGPLFPGLGNDPAREDVVPGSHAGPPLKRERRLIAAAIGPHCSPRLESIHTAASVACLECAMRGRPGPSCTLPRAEAARMAAFVVPALPAARATCGGMAASMHASAAPRSIPARFLRGRMQSPNPGCSTGSPLPYTYDAHSMH